MGGLLSLLLFAALFYVMMRYGCGAHMVHGHGGHGGHGDHAGHSGSSAVSLVDPVCGMEVDAESNYGRRYAGRDFRFCSRNCLEKFDADPDLYNGEKEARA